MIKFLKNLFFKKKQPITLQRKLSSLENLRGVRVIDSGDNSALLEINPDVTEISPEEIVKILMEEYEDDYE